LNVTLPENNSRVANFPRLWRTGFWTFGQRNLVSCLMQRPGSFPDNGGRLRMCWKIATGHEEEKDSGWINERLRHLEITA
jgi:hypothetical protein